MEACEGDGLCRGGCGRSEGMKREKMHDTMIDAGEGMGKKRPAPKVWAGLAAGALAAVLAVSLLLPTKGNPAGVTPAPAALAVAEYPQMAPYPNESVYEKEGGAFDDVGYMEAYAAWNKDVRAQSQYREGCVGAVDAFFAASLPRFLGSSGGENRVYSPLNVYLALGMLAEITEGDSRAQILSLLDCPDLETLRSRASSLWNANYRDDGASASILASSVWLDEDVTLRQEALDTLAQIYYASSYQGQMGSEELNRALRTWLNDQTGGLLENQIGDISLDAQTIMALATTIYFRARWRDEFADRCTESGTFHGAAGDVECDFMHQSHSQNYYWADRFSAISRGLESGGEMWLLLPDEDVSVDDLLASGEAAEFLLRSGDWEKQKFLVVNLSLPKFDVSSQLDLKQGLQELGVTDVFDCERSDFSPLAEHAEGIYVTRVQHDARAAIDEEGVTAAAYTVIPAAGSAMPPEEEVDFVLDRPFLFAVTGVGGAPLFVGVVNQV